MTLTTRYLRLPAALLAGLLLAGCGIVTVNNSIRTGAPSATVKRSSGRLVAARTEVSPAVRADAEIPASQLFTGRWFAADSPWNTTIAALPTDVNSAQLIAASDRRVQALPQKGDNAPRLEQVGAAAGLYINTRSWTDPVVRGGVETQLHCRQLDCGPGSQITELPVPGNVSPNPLYDGWFTIISPTGRTAYDLWRARRLPDDSISYQYMRTWNLRGQGYGAPGQSSARGSGLPLFAGSIRPAELASGLIEHALAISVPSAAPCYYVPPASTTDGSGPADALPEGARLRLKANIKLPARLTAQEKRSASALLWTLRNYGAIVVGQASVPTLYAQGGVTASLLTGSELQWMRLSDFQVVQLPAARRDPWSEPEAPASGCPAAGATL